MKPVLGIAAIVLLAIFVHQPASGQQIGIMGLQNWTSHEDLPSPTGFGGFVQYPFSSAAQSRFTFSYARDNDEFSATIDMSTGFAPAPDLVSDFWNQKASVTRGEFSILFKPVRSVYLSPSFGPSIGWASYKWEIAGKSTGRVKSGDADFRLSLGILANFEFAYPMTRPLVFHFTIHERLTPASPDNCEDCGRYFDDTIVSTEIALLFALRL